MELPASRPLRARSADGRQRVVRVPPKMMAERRTVARRSDPIDALAVAPASLREPELPVASHDEGRGG